MTNVPHDADHQQLRDFAVNAARLLNDRHCEDTLLLDVRGVSHVCHYVLVTSGTSDRQMKSVAAELEDLGRECNQPPFRSNKDDGVTWIVIDFIDLVVHLFEPNHRAYYDLEQLWSDAQTIPWQREDDEVNAAAGR